MSLDDLMHGQSAVLARSIRGEIEPDKFVEVSLSLAERYISLYKQEQKGSVNIGEIVENIRHYEYNTRVEHLLDKHKIRKVDKQRHLALARWYNEFFVKYCILTQMEEIHPHLEHLIEAMEDGNALTLLETVKVFNDALKQSGIKHSEKYLLEMPNQDALFYHQQALQKYKNTQLAGYR